MPFNPSAQNIAQIKLFLELQWTKKRIADHFGCSPRTIQTWKKRIAAENNGGPVAEDQRKLRKPAYLISDGLLHLVLDYMKTRPFMHLNEIINDLQLNCNYKTLSR